MLALGCGDACETLCRSARDRLDTCKPDSLSWEDLGARSRQAFLEDCRTEWSQESSALSASELRVALDVCKDGSDLLDELTCDEVMALYAVDP